MSALNNTKSQPAMFFLTGIVGQENVHVWISIPFCLIYFISILGNSFILFIIKTDPTLHEPMYIFLSILAVTDLGLSITTMPTTLGIFWFNSREISHDACFAQLFFIHFLGFTESSILLLMAFDRLVAIRNPLRYASVLTRPRIATTLLVTLLRGVPIIFPLPILLKQHHFCQANILSHAYCLHQDVMKLACSDIRVNIFLGLFGTLSIAGMDISLILLSYAMILKTVLSIASHAERLKSLDTCVSHVCIVLLFYIPALGLSVLHRFVKMSSPLVQVVMGYVHFLIPPLMNPIVYSVKNKHIRTRMSRMFVIWRISSSPASENQTP
uniref:G-protein coupled receptors family 1 profile domain-containing protein n=1 Tax=Pelusios castaneus TaxID=367368 RepID=A0A8C8VP65_9SAUR